MRTPAFSVVMEERRGLCVAVLTLPAPVETLASAVVEEKVGTEVMVLLSTRLDDETEKTVGSGGE